MPMKRMSFIAALAVCTASQASAGVSGFLLVNGTESAIADASIRRAGTDGWTPLSASPSPGASQAVKFADPDCAFDIRATVAGSGPVTWGRVNLCDVKSVTLKSDPVAGAWVDYDAP
ncbi:MAG: hypothetical protein V4491_05325 [Pseudomonadota bacterium]